MKESPDKVNIEKLAYGGSGIGRVEGKVVFVPLTAPGDLVTFRPVREKKGYIEGELVEVLEPSPSRREPPCPVYGECGGCSWQHLPYDEQVRAKDEIFRETLWRLGTVEKECIKTIIPAPCEWNYRNRAQFKARFVEGKLHVGFYRQKSHFVIDIEECPLMSHLINRTMIRLKEQLAVSPFRDKMPQLDISVSDNYEKAIVIIHLTSLPSKKDIQFAAGLSDDTIVGLYFQSGRKNTVKEIYSCNSGLLDYKLNTAEKEIKLCFSPGGFTQVNYEQNRRLVSEAVGIASGFKPKNILDLYCGMGNFSLPLSLISEKVLGVEDYEGAIKDAIHNAAKNSLSNCRFISGDALSELRKINIKDYDLALVDPPRQGAAAVMKRLAEEDVPRIIYVSCNPATLARDLRILTRNGYKITSSRPIDLFPQTWHIESISVAEKASL